MNVGRFACLEEITNTSGNLSAYEAAPGRYTVRLTVGDVVRSQDFEILMDPRLDGIVADPLAQYAELDRISAEIFASAQAMERGVLLLRQVRQQVDFAMEVGESDAVVDGGTALNATLEGWIEKILQKELRTGQNNYMFEARLLMKYKDFLGRIGGANIPVTQGVRDVERDYQVEWAGYEAELQRILSDDVAEYNRILREAGLPEIYVPRPVT
jgi:hypothetical protein